MATPRGSTRLMGMLVAALAVCPLTAGAGPPQGQYEGKRLDDALKVLQSRGLRIVFSSEIVTTEMRVAAEPRAKDPRKALDELLEPHGLTAREGPGRVLQVVRVKRPAKKAAPLVDQSTTPASHHTPETLRELVTVTAAGRGYQVDAVSVARVPQSQVRGLAGTLADDPLRALQARAGAATGDDFTSEFSVRGSAYRHLGVVVDGVTTNWLRHAAYGRGNTGSIAMITSYGIESATLQAGAYAQRNGGQLGAELDLTLREGSREATLFRAAVTTTQATLVGEGPLGRSARGSWLATARNSHLGWPVRPAGVRTGTVLGFTDLQSKLVYDVSAGQQVSASLLTGRSSVDELDEAHALGDGANRVTLATLAWRSTFGSRMALTQRVSVVDHTFSNQTQTEQAATRGGASAFAYRADVARAFAGGVLDAGAQVQHVQRRGDTLRDATRFLSAYASVAWMPSSRVKVSPGLRIADSTGANHPAVAPWILTEWSLGADWTLGASTGRSYQFPGTESVDRGMRVRGGEPERATHVDIGIGHRPSPGVRWHATWFRRREALVLRDDGAAWLVSPQAGAPSILDSAARLAGSSQGVELRLERQSATGLSGWTAYSYGRTRYRDPSSGETFWGHHDRRHAVTVAAFYRLSDRSTLAATFRGGTNIPVPGQFAERVDGLFAGSHPHELRLPPYARLDVRASRTVHAGRRRVTLFVDVVNVLNRSNFGPGTGVVQAETGEAVGFTERLLPRLPSAGLTVEF